MALVGVPKDGSEHVYILTRMGAIVDKTVFIYKEGGEYPIDFIRRHWVNQLKTGKYDLFVKVRDPLGAT